LVGGGAGETRKTNLKGQEGKKEERRFSNCKPRQLRRFLKGKKEKVRGQQKDVLNRERNIDTENAPVKGKLKRELKTEKRQISFRHFTSKRGSKLRNPDRRQDRREKG